MKPSVLLFDFIALFYPKCCPACGQTLLSGEKCICIFCQFHLPRTNFHLNPDNRFSQIFWGRIGIVTGTALFYYQKGCKVQNLIHEFKYKGKTDIGLFMGEQLGRTIQNSIHYKGLDMIIPVPLHKSRLKVRGFNQSEIFGKGISNILKIPLCIDALLRVNATTTQTRKSRFLRWQNVETVFRVSRPEILENKNILLIDDVLTTGATLEAAARELLSIRGVKIWLATIAITAH
jgi:ComF family protein